MNDWREDAKCAELAPALEQDPEFFDLNADDEERVKRSIWYYFFEGYESEPHLAEQVDDICLDCPVLKECFEYGTTNGETGVFGGVYLTRGNIDQIRNAHKTEDNWAKLMEKMNGPRE